MRTELITPLTPQNITGELAVPDDGEGQAEETVLTQAADTVPACTTGIPTDVQTQPDNEPAVDTAETGHTDTCNPGSLSDPSTPDLILSSPISDDTTLDITEGTEANATVTADREDDSGSMPPLEPVQDNDATGPTGQMALFILILLDHCYQIFHELLCFAVFGNKCKHLVIYQHTRKHLTGRALFLRGNNSNCARLDLKTLEILEL